MERYSLANVLPREDDTTGLAFETADMPLLVQCQERLAMLNLLFAPSTVCKDKSRTSWVPSTSCHHPMPREPSPGCHSPPPPHPTLVLPVPRDFTRQEERLPELWPVGEDLGMRRKEQASPLPAMTTIRPSSFSLPSPQCRPYLHHREACACSIATPI